MHYATDTQRGSSGSPVFNDQWEIVALHHASIRASEQDEFGGYLNEGIRTSRIIRFLREHELEGNARAFLADLIEPERILLAGPHPSRQVPPARPGAGEVSVPAAALARLQPESDSTEASDAHREGAVRISVPLEITIRLGVQPGAVDAPADLAGELSAAEPAPEELEAIRIDPDYGNRRGYDPDFLGSGAQSVPLPALSEALLAKASTFQSASGAPTHVLPYHHFSVTLNRERRLAIFTASNIDGRRSRRLKRERRPLVPRPARPGFRADRRARVRRQRPRPRPPRPPPRPRLGQRTGRETRQ